jgi:hypothetical protein
MIRLALTLATLVGIVPVASATVSPRAEPAPFGEAQRPALACNLLPEVLARLDERPDVKSQFIVTRDTEVLLDLEPCRYEKVPENAIIARMEVGADKRTVLRIYFRSRR